MIYILSGAPIPLARPRFGKNGVYDSQAAIKEKHRFELKFQHEASQKLRPTSHTLDLYDIHDDPKKKLLLRVTFYLPVPLSCSRAKRSQLLNKYHQKKPDLSNCVKYLEDVCIGIILKDDAIIAKIIAQKIYSDIPRTEFEFSYFSDEDDCVMRESGEATRSLGSSKSEA